MTDLKLLGLSISVYTRIARIALEEKGIDYELEEVDIFANACPTRMTALNNKKKHEIIRARLLIY